MEPLKTKETIIQLLRGTNRGCIDQLIEWLEEEGYFECPASTRFHGAYVGGLAKHSLALYHKLVFATRNIDFADNGNFGSMPMTINAENLVIAALLHDVCKLGAYVRTKADDGWTNNRNKEKGHAALSIKRIKKYIALEKLEEMMIRYHMGVYGLKEYDERTGEYNLTSGEKADTRTMTKEQKVASQKRRYGKSLRNAWYHNPIIKVMYFCDEFATMEDLI